MLLFGASDWAYVGGAIAVPVVSGVFGVIIWKLNNVYREVRSPNGASTGSLNYDAWKMGVELREQLTEMRESQLIDREQARSEARLVRNSHATLERKINDVASVQREHAAKFQELYNHLDLIDPHS